MQANKQTILLAAAFSLLFLLMATVRNFVAADYFSGSLALLGLIASLFALYFGLNQKKPIQNNTGFMEANLHALMQNDKDAIWCVNEKFEIISFNKVFAHLFKGFWHRAPQTGMSILFPEGKHAVYKLWNSWYKRALQGEQFTFDFDYNFRDGRRFFEVTITPILLSGKSVGIVAKAIDLTQRKKALQEQQLLAENLQLMLNSTQEIIFEMDENDRCVKVWRSENVRLFYDESYFKNKTVEELFDIPFGLNLKTDFEAVKAHGDSIDAEYQYKVKDKLHYYAAKIRKIHNSHPPRVSIVIEDITKRKEESIKLEQQSIFLNKLISHLPLGVFVKNVKQGAVYTLWNKELENIFGIEEAVVLGKSDEEIYQHSGEIQLYTQTDQMVIEDREPILIQKLRVEVGDDFIYARTFKIPILDSHGEVELILGIVENITENVQQQQDLETAEKRWNYALSGSRDAVWDVNLITDESFFSSVLNEMLGYKSFEKIPHTWEEMVHPEDLPKAWNNFVDHLEGKTHFYEQEYRMLKADGSYIWILDRGKIAETDSEGNPTRAIGTFSNIDYRKRLEQEYKLALEKAQEASKARSLFLSTMSHEIRTPMNGVIGIINLLLNEQPKPEQIENLKALKYSADNLLFLLNDILDFSKIDAGKLDLETNSIQILELVQNNMKSFVGKANEKGIKLQLKSTNDMPKIILGDPLRINQILNNLISNALKFTEKGSVIVSLQKVSSNEQSATIKFSIQDTGIGIEPHLLTSIFEEFTQASNETTRKYGGTGLGLAITKRLIEIMGGKLEVTSELGVGSTFWFTITFEVGKELGQSKEIQASLAEADLNGMEILLVEDNGMNVFVARKFLQKWNVQTTVASNGMEAVDCAQKMDFDLILMDLQMPEMDGFEAAKAIRKFNTTVPIFALTANVNSEAKTAVFESGMNDYISKPFNPDELYKKISSVFAQKHPKDQDKKPISGDLSSLL